MHRTHNPTGTADDTADRSVVTPADILRGAARYLELHGWIQGNYCDDDSDALFPPCCAAGAIVMAAYGRWVNVFDPAIDSNDFDHAIGVLADYLDRCSSHPAPEPPFGNDPASYNPQPYDWNDHPTRTADQVIAVLHAAADDYDTELSRVRTQVTDDSHDDMAELLDTGGYLACGCHGSQRDHTCGPLD